MARTLIEAAEDAPEAAGSHDAVSDDWALLPQRSLPDMIAEKILLAVRRGDIRPGERLRETHLAARLGVSRGPLREALRILEASHLVESRRGHGTYVRHVSRDDMVLMIPVRATLEGLAARLVAIKADDALINRLELHHEEIEAAARAGNTAAWRRLDWSFHEFVCKSADNEVLFAGWRLIGNLVLLFLDQHDAFEVDADSVIGNHRNLLDAIRSRDPDHAEHVFRLTILTTSFASLGLAVPEGMQSVRDTGGQVRKGPVDFDVAPEVKSARSANRRK